MDLKTLRTIQVIIICAISMISCQLFKFVIFSIKEKKFFYKALFTTGGMPSSHTSTVTTLVGVLAIFQFYDTRGFSYTLAVAAVLAAFIIHDSMGVRLEASKHARILNKLVEDESKEVKSQLGYGKKHHLKELLGHQPLEVFFGFLFGVFVALVGAVVCIF